MHNGICRIPADVILILEMEITNEALEEAAGNSNTGGVNICTKVYGQAAS